MPNIQTIHYVSGLLSDIDTLYNCTAIAKLTEREVPENYKYIRSVVVKEHRISIYDMDMVRPSYLVSISNVGSFQVF